MNHDLQLKLRIGNAPKTNEMRVVMLTETVGTSKGFVANPTFETFWFPAVNEDVLFAGFTPCGAGHIGAELYLRVHMVCSRVW
jgi:hypothetical protein